jgi:hypothetical protein
MSKPIKRTKKNLGKKGKKGRKSMRNKKNRTYRKKCTICNIKFGGCSDCGMSMVSGGKCTNCKKGGSLNMDKLPTASYYPLNNYSEDVSQPPYIKSSTLLGDYSRTTGGKRKSKKSHRVKGGGVLNFLQLPSSDYVTTHNNINGVWDQKNILAGKSIISSNPMDQPALKNPYGSSINPPLV